MVCPDCPYMPAKHHCRTCDSTRVIDADKVAEVEADALAEISRLEDEIAYWSAAAAGAVVDDYWYGEALRCGRDPRQVAHSAVRNCRGGLVTERARLRAVRPAAMAA